LRDDTGGEVPWNAIWRTGRTGGEREASAGDIRLLGVGDGNAAPGVVLGGHSCAGDEPEEPFRSPAPRSRCAGGGAFVEPRDPNAGGGGGSGSQPAAAGALATGALAAFCGVGAAGDSGDQRIASAG